MSAECSGVMHCCARLFNWSIFRSILSGVSHFRAKLSSSLCCSNCFWKVLLSAGVVISSRDLCDNLSLDDVDLLVEIPDCELAWVTCAWSVMGIGCIVCGGTTGERTGVCGILACFGLAPV